MSPPERAGLPGKEALSAILYYRKCTRNINNNILREGVIFFYVVCIFRAGPFSVL